MTSRLPVEISASRPLRCTSLHQSISADTPDAITSVRLSQSLPGDKLLEPGVVFSDGESENSASDASMEEGATLSSEMGTPVNAHRSSTVHQPQRRKKRSTSSGKLSHQHLSITYTSPKTTADAISIFNSRKDADRANTSRSFADHRETFLAELPADIAHVRSVNYRRGALLPRPKSFTRVQQSLSEEISPADADALKEAKLAGILRSKEEGLKAQGEMDQIIDNMASAKSSGLDGDTSARLFSKDKNRIVSPFTSPDVLGTPIQEEEVFIFDDLSPRTARFDSTSSASDERESTARLHRKRKNSVDARFEP